MSIIEKGEKTVIVMFSMGTTLMTLPAGLDTPICGEITLLGMSFVGTMKLCKKLRELLLRIRFHLKFGAH